MNKAPHLTWGASVLILMVSVLILMVSVRVPIESVGLDPFSACTVFASTSRADLLDGVARARPSSDPTKSTGANSANCLSLSFIVNWQTMSTVLEFFCTLLDKELPIVI